MGEDGSEAAAVLLGMPGFDVLVADEAPDGQVWLLVQSAGPAPSCSSCGRRAESKGRKEVSVRDLLCGGRPVVLVWRKRRWACVDQACAVKTWTERSELVLPRAVLTERAKDEIFRQLGAHVRPTIEIARGFGVHWGTAWAAFASRAQPLIDDPDRTGGVEALGLDETGFLKATAQHPKLWATGLVDVRRGILVDVIEGRDAHIVRGWLNCQTLEWCQRVKVVSIDPFEAYRSGLKPRLAHATVVADPFHIVRLANTAWGRRASGPRAT